MNRAHSACHFLLGISIAFGSACVLVMDSDFDKYQSADMGGMDAGGGEGGEGGGGGEAGIAGQGGSAGAAGSCEPLMTLNEIQTGGPGDPDDEFVELYNAGSCPAFLEEYVLVYRSASATTDHSVTWSGQEGRTVNPNEFFLIGGSTFPGIPDARLPSNFALGASGGGLALRRLGTTVDRVGWGNADNGFVEDVAAPAPPVGESIARFPDGADTDHNAKDFAVTTPTPGTPNPPR